MTPFVWMFISSYEKEYGFLLIDQKTITSLINLNTGRRRDGPHLYIYVENAHKAGISVVGMCVFQTSVAPTGRGLGTFVHSGHRSMVSEHDHNLQLKNFTAFTELTIDFSSASTSSSVRTVQAGTH